MVILSIKANEIEESESGGNGSLGLLFVDGNNLSSIRKTQNSSDPRAFVTARIGQKELHREQPDSLLSGLHPVRTTLYFVDDSMGCLKR